MERGGAGIAEAWGAVSVESREWLRSGGVEVENDSGRLSSSSVKPRTESTEQSASRPPGKSTAPTPPFPNRRRPQLARIPRSIPHHFLPRAMAPIAGGLSSRTRHCGQPPSSTSPPNPTFPALSSPTNHKNRT
ncbi:hypothetical protein SETIT_2G275700v2 [Setaria italica]|uniref:Uncharacterized protein n=2 Tax=Setaria italica TaxID=4555 RepID=A0A368Q3S1_SETIT|nr:hypothetical protein SETIT_2G275700v2 [Setaria italica]